MSDKPKIDDKARAQLKEQLDGLAAVEAAISVQMAPLQKALQACQSLRDQLLDVHGLTEVLETCEGCAKLLFEGDLGHRCADGPVLCEECSPTYVDCANQLRETLAAQDDGDDEERQTAKDSLLGIEALIVEGRGDQKAVHPL